MSKQEKAKLSDLEFDGKNFNKGTAYGKSLMTKSLSKFGAGRSILIDKHGRIIAGNKTAETFGEIGMEEVVIVKTDGRQLIAVQRDDIDLDSPEGRELALADNQTAKLNIDWDFEQMESELEAQVLEEWGIDIIHEKEVEAIEDDYMEAVPEKAKTVLGDLYTFEKGGKALHRLLCGDSTDSDQLAKLMNGQKADMVFTDPPYNVNYGQIKHEKFKQREIKNDNLSKSDFQDFCQAFVSNIKLFCDGVVYCWSGPGVDGRLMFTALDEALHCSTVVVWNKDQFTLGRGKYQNKHEFCWFGWNKSGASFIDDRTLTNVWEAERPKSSELHPTMKPIELVTRALSHNPKAELVMDLFLGSGSTMVGAHQLDRRCYGLELDEKYCDVIVRRMLQLDSELKVKRNGECCQSEFTTE